MLLILRQSQGEKVEKDFLSQFVWPDLIENNLEDGLSGKHTKIRPSGPLVHVLNSVRAKEMAEVERNKLLEKRSKNEKQLLEENLEKRKQYQEEKAKIASEKSKKIEFVQKLNRSLDAARAVDAAYAYKERQNKFGKLVELNQRIKSGEKQGKERLVEFRTQYRLQVCYYKSRKFNPFRVPSSAHLFWSIQCDTRFLAISKLRGRIFFLGT